MCGCMSTLLEDIEAFLGTHEELSATAFGERALGDRHLVHQMKRRGRRLWPETERKVRHFMATYRPDPPQDAAA